MFRYEIDAPPYGRLWKQGQHTKNWSGKITLPPFDGAFDVVLHGTKDGPLPEQVAAMATLLRDVMSIHEAASRPMCDLYREAFLERLPDPDAPRSVWSFLKPCFIEICGRSYYGDGRICILIALESREQPDFVPAIETADGRFADVLSGT